MEPVFKYTNGSEYVAKVAAWRLYPFPLTLANFPHSLRPTQLQTTVPYPPVIDWCMFPFLRDKLIMHHSIDPSLDDICRDIGQAHVVRADLKDLVLGANSLAVKFRVYDIIDGMENNPSWFTSRGDDSDIHTVSQPRPRIELPAPSLQVLLNTREYAWELYRYLDLQNVMDGICLDSRFFSKYPHLYQPDPAIALGVFLSTSNRTVWSMPQPLDYP
ncbi:hypothetical protein B0A52_06019 [Exophiala mesophila]|uniref:Uncharacterized protein n=1 Tax=Exophiala mesophila TaxID=212818 RepID=A0A438N5C0_EXOME|nr:hypothetical protein B0A52_06019 [Exophiala mesophila]